MPTEWPEYMKYLDGVSEMDYEHFFQIRLGIKGLNG